MIYVPETRGRFTGTPTLVEGPSLGYNSSARGLYFGPHQFYEGLEPLGPHLLGISEYAKTSPETRDQTRADHLLRSVILGGDCTQPGCQNPVQEAYKKSAGQPTIH